MSKIETAIEIVKANSDKKVALDTIVEELGVTRANAFVYWAKAAKVLGMEQAPRQPKAARKVNPITETTPEKAAEKIAEIDAVIAGLRQAGAVSPFPVAA